MANTPISQNLIEILLVLGKLEQTSLSQLMECVKKTSIPAGRVLVMCQRLTEDELTQCLLTAQAISSGKQSFERGVILLKMKLADVHFEHWQVQLFEDVSSMCLLLMARGTIRISDLEKAALKCPNKINGRELHRLGLLSLPAWQEAIELLHRLKLRVSSLSDFGGDEENLTGSSMKARRLAKKDIKLGEMLVQSGIFDEETVLESLEFSIDQGKLFGQTLKEQTGLPQRILQACLVLQKYVENKTLSKEQAVSLLREISVSELTIGQVMRQFIAFKLEMLRLLVAAGIVSPSLADKACTNLLTPPLALFAFLIDQGIANSAVVKTALRCLILIKQGKMSKEHAVEALKKLQRQTSRPARWTA